MEEWGKISVENKKLNKYMGRISIPDDNLIQRFISIYNKEQEDVDKVVKEVFNTYDDSSFSNILIKVIVLNMLYNTMLLSKDNVINARRADVIIMAKHIYKNCADELRRIKEKNGENIEDDVICLVEKMRKVKKTKREEKRKGIGRDYFDEYSFATKYCAWSIGVSKVPIVDSKVKGMLYLYSMKVGTQYFDIKPKELLDYRYFVKKYNEFINTYFSKNYVDYKEVDKFLWQYAKCIESGDL